MGNYPPSRQRRLRLQYWLSALWRSAAGRSGPPHGVVTAWWAGGGRRHDEVLVRAEQARTAARPPRVQTGQADLIEAVDHSPDGVLAGLDQLGDDRDPVPTGRGQEHHRAPVAHRA